MKKSLVIFGLCFLFLMMSFVVAQDCIPKTCSDFGCGFEEKDDGCGGILNCENCVPKTCSQIGRNCGLTDDGCCHPMNCGNCSNCDYSTGHSIGTCISEKTCSSIKAECGKWDNGFSGQIDCGKCINGACIVGKCYSFSQLGNCISLNEKYGNEKPTCANQQFDANFGEDSGKEEICQAVGCQYNPNNPLTCEGTPTSCSTQKEDCLIGLAQSCIWENSDIYTPKMYWKGNGGLTPTGWLIVSVDKEFIQNPDKNPISLSMVLENSRLPESTEVSFEIYKPQPSSFEVHKILEPYEIRIASTGIKSVVDKDGNAVAEWIITKEDLAKAHYNGRDRIEFEVIVDGKHFSSLNLGAFPINESENIGSINIDQKSLLLVTKKGDCRGTIPCNVFSSKWECEESKGEDPNSNCIWSEGSKSCSGKGISCSIIGDGETCKTWKCSWTADNLWERFTDWIGSLFGAK